MSVIHKLHFVTELIADETNSPLAVPMDTIHKNDNGKYYVWRAKGLKAFQIGKALKGRIIAEQVPVTPGDQFKTIYNLKLESLKDPGNLKVDDVIIANFSGQIQDNKPVIIDQTRWLFAPWETVKVKVRVISVPGFYVPKTAVYRGDKNQAYVYCNDNGKCRKVNITIEGEYGKLYRIKGAGLKEGDMIILTDQGNQIKENTPIKIDKVTSSII